MSLHLRILLAYSLLVSLAVYLFVTGAIEELRPGVRQATEQTLVNTAHLMAELVTPEFLDGNFADSALAETISNFNDRNLDANIWSLHYEKPDLRVYITNASGIVVFDSTGEATGQDYSQWNDVYLTLKGGYGVRSTLAQADNKLSSVMYVAAPIRFDGEIVGSLTVSRPNLSLQPFVEMARENLRVKGAVLLLAALILAAVISYFLTRSIRKLKTYAEQVSRGQRSHPPQFNEPELNDLARAMDFMCVELEGKEYVENYIHTLTHELKSPLTAIAASAELLATDLDENSRERFSVSINLEVERIRQLIDRLLALAAVEKRSVLHDVEVIDLCDLMQLCGTEKDAILKNRLQSMNIECDKPFPVKAEAFLLRQAINNLLDNAIEFSPSKGEIKCSVSSEKQSIKMAIEDEGPGVPDYALERVTERFYSLPRPGSDRKSTGLGLSFVSEVAELHGGYFKLENTDKGARASIILPLARIT